SSLPPGPGVAGSPPLAPCGSAEMTGPELSGDLLRPLSGIAAGISAAASRTTFLAIGPIRLRPPVVVLAARFRVAMSRKLEKAPRHDYRCDGYCAPPFVIDPAGTSERPARMVSRRGIPRRLQAQADRHRLRRLRGDRQGVAQRPGLSEYEEPRRDGPAIRSAVRQLRFWRRGPDAPRDGNSDARQRASGRSH